MSADVRLVDDGFEIGIRKSWGGDDREPLPADPRRSQYGFKTADAIAMKLGVEKTAKGRLLSPTLLLRRSVAK
jgi:hypothetical protein